MTACRETPPPLRTLFVGGPGRSGTSLVADRLGRHAGVASLKDVELKIYCEKNGLQDLFHALVATYSPNRAGMALDQFRRLAEALVEGCYGQLALAALAPAETWRAIFADFADGLLEHGHPVEREPEDFLARARALHAAIAALAASIGRRRREVAAQPPATAARPGVAPFGPAALFLEKTPHNLLALGFLSRLVPGALYLHVMRDPRSIAWSLTTMRWGPSDLATAARWVASYCGAWSRAEARAADLGLPLLRTHIEDIAAAPGPSSLGLTAALGLAPAPGLFAGADPETLNRWPASAGRAALALLDSALGGWVAHFGYDPARIGHRTGRGEGLVQGHGEDRISAYAPTLSPPVDAGPSRSAERDAATPDPARPDPATPDPSRSDSPMTGPDTSGIAATSAESG